MMTVDDWVKYGGDDSNQIQWCNKLGREYIPSPAPIGYGLYCLLILIQIRCLD